MKQVLELSLALWLAMFLAGCDTSTSDPAAATEQTAKPATEASKAEATPIRVTGIPDENPTDLIRKNEPLVKFLTDKLGTKVVYHPVTDYGAAVEALAAGKVDFAWLGGFTFVQAKIRANASPLCMREIDRNFQSVFIAHTDSAIANLADIKGKKFSFGSKSSTSGHLMPRYYLNKQFALNPETDFDGPPLFSGAHDATAKMVESGQVQAGALNAQVWRRMVNEQQVDTNKVKAIWTTPGYVDYVWAARANLAVEIQTKFKDALIGLSATNPADQEVLALQRAKRFVPASAADFEPIESVAKSVGMLK